MATDKKTIGISSLITLGLISLFMITPNFFENDKYYCESRGLIETCNSLSGGLGTRCYINEEASSWLVCREGWIPIENDIQENETKQEQETKPTKKDGVWGVKYSCNQNECIIIN